MNCHNHPENEAISKCSICGKPICSECYMEIAGNSYCKECVNDLVTKSIVENAIAGKTANASPATEPATNMVQATEPTNMVQNTEAKIPQQTEEIINNEANTQKESLESIPPIEKPQQIPHEAVKEAPKGFTEEISSEIPTQNQYQEINPEQYTAPSQEQMKEKVVEEPIIPEPAKDPENYQPEIEYEPEYVEIYGEEEEEDTYYQNPETINEPIPEKERFNKRSDSFEQTSQESYNDFDIIEPIHNESDANEVESVITPNKNLESKYEKYLEDLYYDEEPKDYQKDRPNYTEELKEQGALSLRAQLAQDEAEHGPLTKNPYVPFNPEEQAENDEELSEGFSNNYTNETYQEETVSETKEDIIEPITTEESPIKGYNQITPEEAPEQYQQPQQQYQEINPEQFPDGKLPPLKPVQSIYRDEEGNEYIIPIHQDPNQENLSPEQSYEAIKRKIENGGNISRQNQEQFDPNQDKYQRFVESPENKQRGNEKRFKRSKKENLENIQKIHKNEPKQKDDGFTKTEIVLTVILIILIILVIIYVIYLFTLNGDYPTFMDAFWGLIYHPDTFMGYLFN